MFQFNPNVCYKLEPNCQDLVLHSNEKQASMLFWSVSFMPPKLKEVIKDTVSFALDGYSGFLFSPLLHIGLPVW